MVIAVQLLKVSYGIIQGDIGFMSLQSSNCFPLYCPQTWDLKALSDAIWWQRYLVQSLCYDTFFWWQTFSSDCVAKSSLK